MVKNWEQLNGLALAYIGDGIYEIMIRMYVLEQGFTKPNKLHSAATKYVSAKAQCFIMEQLLAQEMYLTEEELLYYRRGRNSKSHTSAKNADIVTYRIATGFEALIGYLHLSGQQERLEQMVEYCITIIEEK